ncbi:MAG: PAS domain S-box protein, partial [Ignavibacteriales bacterium]|nr:PAS domain S-box protein [Ignavibacteriales bacterium]
MKKSKVSILTNKKHVIALIAIISLLITVSGYFYYKHQENLILQQKYTELKMITDLKQSQIEQWLKQRNADVKLVAQSPFFIKGIEQWLKDTGNVQLKLDIIELLKPVKKEQGYENIILAASNGQLLVSVKPGFEDIDTLPKQNILEATQKGEIVFTDIYWCKAENRVHYDIITPVINSGKKTIAVLLFRRDLKSFLYPLLHTWPMPSKSAETYLVRVEGDSVHFLNNLRFLKNTAMKFRIPLARTEVTAVQAVLGRTGIFEGVDYRGVEVLADMRRIPAANWIMVSKIDISEIYSGLYITAGVIFGFSIFLIIICGVGFALIYNSQQKKIFLELYSKEKELWQQQEKFEVTINSFGDGVITADSNGKIQYLNKMAEELTGWNFREARGRMLGEVYTVKNEETGQIANDILEKVNKQGIIKELANHTILTSKSGKEIPVMDTGAPIYDNDGSTIGIVIVFEDETEKRRQLKLLKGSEFRLRSTLDSMMEGCQIIGFDFRYLFLNKAALIQSKLAKEEILAKTMMECYPGIENTKMFSALRYCMEKRIKGSMENEFLYPDGAKRIFQLRFEPVPEGTFILSEDITERKQAEEKIRHVNRALSVLSNTNQAIVRIKDKQELFHEVCRIAVESGKFRMTWIGMLDEQTKKVNPVASAGSAEEYLKTTTIDLSDEKLCNGPTGRAITS